MATVGDGAVSDPVATTDSVFAASVRLPFIVGTVSAFDNSGTPRWTAEMCCENHSLEDVLYVSTDQGTVYALDAATGAVLWSAAAGAAITHPPALARGSLYVPTADGTLVVLAAAGCGAPTCAPE